MAVTRREVLEHLATASDGETRETTIEALAAALEADERTIESHLHGLADCELARIRSDGSARVTITGEELLELELDELVIVDPETMNPNE
ncbi:hypothetical protein ACFR99_13105 [Haloarchaeobius amylolyticus]|uniref:ArsR family transcriptional regulator n=1 Tax=Haloarchaeobius amylolyticus TaxID=1198296 RepID=A0ABD6BHH1_9EURY